MNVHRNTLQRGLRWTLGSAIVLATAGVGADTVMSHVFTPGTSIRAVEVNENFAQLARQIDAVRQQKQDLLFGGTLAGTKHLGAALSVVNEARVDPIEGRCDAQGGTTIYAKSSSHNCGAYANAAVLAENDAPTHGVGVQGVSTSSEGGAGVLGIGSEKVPGLRTWGSGLLLEGGGITVTRADRPMAFVHVATAENTQGAISCIDHPLANGAPDAVLTFNHKLQTPPVYLNVETGLRYDTPRNKWCIQAEDGTTSLLGHAFTVMVINTV